MITLTDVFITKPVIIHDLYEVLSFHFEPLGDPNSNSLVKKM